jgi:hypothetical protein
MFTDPESKNLEEGCGNDVDTFAAARKNRLVRRIMIHEAVEVSEMNIF